MASGPMSTSRHEIVHRVRCTVGCPMVTNPNKQYPNNRYRFPQVFRDISFSKELLGYFIL
jgi:uncharacterized Zn-finger protein